ncbi:hypothetical protein GUITHDRAFT_111497 [Guillardia theta CCMP2712]|uniref:Uncharacterized protein n=1 Tax=Guillardia theta (strain CCMP2712) TaxID=905079 RepID=L1J2H8_GUITC|nr:hypothetical protein GUITHDRAFT_111497 [Guillardia theta CCMP2712]EKX42522.1 hypothetical protein GUITHDRAFT_111497 [Guillardia theta CCMP2712]|eukprot:XP_005829502.1 hypothetical protein GUITHDRAFT_111497 [Guillardia theta CCMP2712]
MLISVSLNYFSAILFLILPFALLGFLVVFIAIYFKWKRGIQIFIGISLVQFVLALIPFVHIVFVLEQGWLYWHRVLIFLFEMVLHLTGVLLGIRLLMPVEEVKEEQVGLIGKVKNATSSLKDKLVNKIYRK